MTGAEHAEGEFRTVWGSSRLSRLLARRSPLPRPSERSPVKLRIECERGGERWIRIFEDHCFVSTQVSDVPGMLQEDVGRYRFQFRLEAGEGGIRYCQCGCALRFGRGFVRLPTWMSPSIEASETASESDDSVTVRVSIRAPIVGFLAEYGGRLRVVEASACM